MIDSLDPGTQPMCFALPADFSPALSSHALVAPAKRGERARDFSPVDAGESREGDWSASNTDQKGSGALIDWCTLVFPASVLSAVTDHSLHEFLRHVFGRTGITNGSIRDRFFNFYPQSVVLMGPDGQRAGDIGFGGDKDTICVSLSGAGCRWVRDWSHVRDVAAQLGARLSRCDVAYDDVEGKVFDLPTLIELAKAGGFASGGRPPETGDYSDHGSGKGCTLKVGGKGHKELCIYEKGKQLGDPDSPWVRCECRLYGKHVGKRNPDGTVTRTGVDLDALVEPLVYLRGSYDVLASLLVGVCYRMKTVRAAVDASAEALVKWTNTQVGPSLHLLHEALGDDFLGFLEKRVFRESIPGRFRKTGAHDDLVSLLRVSLLDV